MGCVGAAVFLSRGVRSGACGQMLAISSSAWLRRGKIRGRARIREDNDAITTDKEHDVSRQTNVVTKTMPHLIDLHLIWLESRRRSRDKLHWTFSLKRRRSRPLDFYRYSHRLLYKQTQLIHCPKKTFQTRRSWKALNLSAITFFGYRKRWEQSRLLNCAAIIFVHFN
jgi:hypothetical protein